MGTGRCAELLFQHLVAVDNPCAPLHACLGREPTPPLAHRLEKNGRSPKLSCRMAHLLSLNTPILLRDIERAVKIRLCHEPTVLSRPTIYWVLLELEPVKQAGLLLHVQGNHRLGF